MPRQDDAPYDLASLPSAPLFRRIALEVIEQAGARDRQTGGGFPERALFLYLNADPQPSEVTDWVERVLREALRG